MRCAAACLCTDCMSLHVQNVSLGVYSWTVSVSMHSFCPRNGILPPYFGLLWIKPFERTLLPSSQIQLSLVVQYVFNCRHHCCALPKKYKRFKDLDFRVDMTLDVCHRPHVNTAVAAHLQRTSVWPRVSASQSITFPVSTTPSHPALSRHNAIDRRHKRTFNGSRESLYPWVLKPFRKGVDTWHKLGSNSTYDTRVHPSMLDLIEIDFSMSKLSAPRCLCTLALRWKLSVSVWGLETLAALNKLLFWFSTEEDEDVLSSILRDRSHIDETLRLAIDENSGDYAGKSVCVCVCTLSHGPTYTEYAVLLIHVCTVHSPILVFILLIIYTVYTWMQYSYTYTDYIQYLHSKYVYVVQSLLYSV